MEARANHAFAPPARLRSLLLVLGVLLVMTGCTLSTSGGDGDSEEAISGPPVVTLAAPLPNAAYRETVNVVIQASISNAGPDIAQVTVTVDNQPIITLQSPNESGAPVFSITQTWPATGVGSHTISVVASRADGASSDPATVTINVVDSASLPSSSTATPTTGAGSGGPAPTTQSSGPTNTIAPTNTLAPTQPAATSTPDVPTARFITGINVRSGPGTNFDPPIGAFPANETAEILALNTQETWLKVRYGGGEGWVFADLVEIQGNTSGLPREVGPPTPIPTAPPAPTAAPTSASSVNITVIEPFISPPQPQCGQQFTVGMTIQNNSTVETTIGLSRIQDVHVASGNVVTSSGDALVAVTLAPGATHRVTFNFTINAFFGELHRIEFIADVNSQVVETNEQDNRIGVEYTLPANCP